MNRGNSIVPFSCTIVMPYELVWVVGLYLFSPTFVRSMTSWSKEYIFHSSLSLVLNPCQSSKMWIEPLACLVFIALLIPFLDSRRLLGRVDQRKANLVFFSFGSFMLKPLYVCTQLDHSISVVLVVTTTPLTLGCLSAFSAPRSWYPTSGLSTRILLCVTPF